MEDLEEKYARLKQLLEEYVEKNAELADALAGYQSKDVPKYGIGQELFCLDVPKHEIYSLKVEEIIINKFGIAYREYVKEDSFKQFPEHLCFLNKIEANETLIKNK